MATTAGEKASPPAGVGEALASEPVDESVIQLLAARLAQPGEGVLGAASANAAVDPEAGAQPAMDGTEKDAEAGLAPLDQALVEPLELMYYARLEECPFPEDGTGTAILLDKPYCIIGRRTADADPVDVSIDSTKVSRRHARIQFNYFAGGFELMVWGRNGSYVEYPEWYDTPEPDRKIFTEGSETPRPVALVHEWVTQKWRYN